jgi:hypothetical protein
MTSIRPFHLSSGACETLKWIALACMLIDHINSAFYAREIAWMTPVGRIAMPLFTLVLGYNLARPGSDPDRLLKKLLIFGLVAQPFHAILAMKGSWLPLNVLFTFAAGIAYTQWVQKKNWTAAIALLVVATLTVDYSFVGVLLLAASWFYFSNPTPKSLTWLAVAIGGLCLFNNNFYALLGVAIFYSAAWWTFRLPRSKWLFWIVYPAHFALLIIIKLWLLPEWSIPAPYLNPPW